METARQKVVPEFTPKPSLKTLYGEPIPNGIAVITAELITLAVELLAVSNEMVIQFVREPPLISLNYSDLSGGFNRCSIGRTPGRPLGVCLAFQHEGEVYAGWSRRNDAMVQATPDLAAFENGWRDRLIQALEVDELLIQNPNDDEEAAANDPVILALNTILPLMAAEYVEPMPLEPLPFSKRDARKVAIMRALTDDIVVRKGKKEWYTRDGRPLPTDVRKMLKRVINKAYVKFKVADIKNVTFSST